VGSGKYNGLRTVRIRRYMWWLLADEFGGIHPEALRELAQRGHARLYFVALDPGDGRRGDWPAGSCGHSRSAGW
jgi:hypothetical protein